MANHLGITFAILWKHTSCIKPDLSLQIKTLCGTYYTTVRQVADYSVTVMTFQRGASQNDTNSNLDDPTQTD